MARREFIKSVRVEILQRAKVPTGFQCEQCKAIVAGGEVHHIKQDAMETEEDKKARKLTEADGAFLCYPCHDAETKAQAPVMAKVKRIEAKHMGAAKPKGQIASRGFQSAGKPPTDKHMPPRRMIYVDR